MLVEDEIKHNVLRHHQGSKAQKQGARSLKSLKGSSTNIPGKEKTEKSKESST
jgi:hypothetical protein